MPHDVHYTEYLMNKIDSRFCFHRYVLHKFSGQKERPSSHLVGNEWEQPLKIFHGSSPALMEQLLQVTFALFIWFIICMEAKGKSCVLNLGIQAKDVWQVSKFLFFF